MYLMPAAEAIYDPFGFRFIYEANAGTEISSAPDRITAKELGRAISDFLMMLSERDRRMFVLRYVTAETPEMIAGKLGITTSSLNVRLHRLRAKLRAYLKERGYIDG